MWRTGVEGVSVRKTSVGTTVLTAALLLTGWDLVRIYATAPDFGLRFGGALAFILVGGAATASILAIPLAARRLLEGALTQFGTAGAALLGALDAAAFICAAVLIQDPRSVSSDRRVLIALVSVIGLAAMRGLWHAHRHRFHALADRVLGALLIAGSLAALTTLRWNGSDALRLALQLIFAIGLAGLLPLAPSRRSAWGAIPLAICAALVGGASGLLHASDGARFALHHRGSQVRPAIAMLEWLSDSDGDAASALLGGRDCDPKRADIFPGAAEIGGDGVDHNCSGADGAAVRPRTARSAQVGAARGRDLLLLSIDSLRWDALHELASLRAALGPHVVFERAVSTAPATKESLSSALRGRPLRRLRFETTPDTHGAVLWRDHSPTLAHALAQGGYRVFTVPTSHVGDPRNGVQSGFDSIWAANYDAREQPPARSPFARQYLAAPEALAVLETTARATPGPLCAWVHLMESHAPYPVQNRASCDPHSARDCYGAALRETSDRLALFVREFTRLRGHTPVIAIFGDHGEEFGEHGGDFHASSVYAEQVRVSFLLAAEGVLPALRVQAPVSLAALPATVLDLLGVEVPPTMLEPSLLPALRAETPFPNLAVSELPIGRLRMVGYTGTRYRYLRDPVHEVELLFDMDADPYEQRDVSTTDRAGLLAMRSLARAWDETEQLRALPEKSLSAEAERSGESARRARPKAQ